MSNQRNHTYVQSPTRLPFPKFIESLSEEEVNNLENLRKRENSIYRQIVLAKHYMYKGEYYRAFNMFNDLYVKSRNMRNDSRLCVYMGLCRYEDNGRNYRAFVSDFFIRRAYSLDKYDTCVVISRHFYAKKNYLMALKYMNRCIDHVLMSEGEDLINVLSALIKDKSIIQAKLHSRILRKIRSYKLK